MSPMTNIPSSVDSMKISVFNEETRSDIEKTINTGKPKVIHKILEIIADLLTDNYYMLLDKNSLEERIKATKTLSRPFFQQHVINELSQLDISNRIQLLVTQNLANRVKEKWVTENSQTSDFFKLLSSNTDEEIVKIFFIIQSIGEAKKITTTLEATYTDTILNEFFKDSQPKNLEEVKQ